jgi:hypothetical protein
MAIAPELLAPPKPPWRLRPLAVFLFLSTNQFFGMLINAS